MRYAVALCLLASSAVYAGDQYLDRSGYAVGGYDVVAFQSLEAGSPAVPGSSEFTAEHNGSLWAFSTAANRDLFSADPAKYAPQYDGHCAYGVAQGAKVPANPNLWKVVDDKLYLNINPGVAKRWEKDALEYIVQSDSKWASLESNAASTESWRSMWRNRGTYDDNTPSL